jgi:hypothetical protein
MNQKYYSKEMKNAIITILLLFSCSLNAQQKGNGVYITLQNYENNILSYETDCKHKRSIKIHELFNLPFITVKWNKRKLKLKKDSIFAVQFCDEPLIRFQDKESYYLAEKGSVWIFYKEERIYSGKSSMFLKKYFFCVEGNGILRSLTVSNLKYALPTNHKFHDMLDAYFIREDASDYDSFYKTFKVNHFLKECSTN